MSTALSWNEWRRGTTDLRILLGFRTTSLPSAARRRLRITALCLLAITVAFVVVPAYGEAFIPQGKRGSTVALLPSIVLGFLGLTLLSSAATGGGREVLPRDQGVAYPISTITDHLGALLLAPVNIAFILQTWTLLGATAYGMGRVHPYAYVVVLILWVIWCTAFAQVIGWGIEGLRRGAHGVAVVRALFIGLAVLAAIPVLLGKVTYLLDRAPTSKLVFAAWVTEPDGWRSWGICVAILAGMIAVTVVAGAAVAHWALMRPMREELRLESGRHQARATPASDLAMMLRIDRGSVWRSVPLRRGVMVLALMPGLVALTGKLEWEMLTILPGLVASGAALLFGVNAWCLDGRGTLWRENLPISPKLGFVSRMIVMAEVLLVAAAVTLVLASLRAGTPTAGELSALVCATVVVTAQVVSAGMRWSIARPFAMDLRSARATPAPPVVMAGYSARLALATTMTGLMFSALSHASDPRWSLSIATLFLLTSGLRLSRASNRWADPVIRSRVVVTVAG